MNNVVGDGLMNEKRFYLLSYKNYPIYDSVEDKEYNARFRKQREKLCDLLNEWVTECNQLQKENEHLRQVNNDFEKLFFETISIADTSQLLETGNYDIKRMFVKELVDSLMSENEQLRNEVAHWKHRVFSLLWILGQFDKDKVKELLKEIDDE